jgi:hypothetical protein
VTTKCDWHVDLPEGALISDQLQMPFWGVRAVQSRGLPFCLLLRGLLVSVLGTLVPARHRKASRWKHTTECGHEGDKCFPPFDMSCTLLAWKSPASVPHREKQAGARK